ncbi:MAG: ClpX C4-type zinc finger protein [Pseudomonadota bacterium]
MPKDKDQPECLGPESKKNLEALRNRLINIEKKAIRKAQASSIKETVKETCSFCGKDGTQVVKLLQATSGATICNECIQSYMKETSSK